MGYDQPSSTKTNQLDKRINSILGDEYEEELKELDFIETVIFVQTLD